MFYEVFVEEERLLRQFLSRGIKAGFTSLTIQEAHPQQGPAPVICIRTQSEIPIAWADRLQGILTRSSGYDHLSRYRQKAHTQLPCGYLPRYSSRAVAEQAILMMLALLRRLPKQLENFCRFNRSGITGRECLNKNLLVVGVGHIGKEIVDLAKGMGMKVKGVDIVKREKDLAYTALKAGVSWAEVIICALPLTKKTPGLFNYRLLRNAKKGVLFINVSRGEISPIREVKRLWKEQILGGVSLDVFEEEGALASYLRGNRRILPQSARELLSLQRKENVLLTPHNAFNTVESIERKARQTAKALHYFLEHKDFPTPIPNED